MSEQGGDGAGGAGPEKTFETLETELEAKVRRLEDPAVPLERRLALHAGAVRLHQRLEAQLEAAKTEMAAAERDTAVAEAPEEPYEVVRDRLAAVVAELEKESLPLARVVVLHREAWRLASRCEAILTTAQEKMQQIAGEPGAAPAPTTASAPDEDDNFVPF